MYVSAISPHRAYICYSTYGHLFTPHDYYAYYPGRSPLRSSSLPIFASLRSDFRSAHMLWSREGRKQYFGNYLVGGVAQW